MAEKKLNHKNPMKEIRLEKVVLNCGGSGDKLEKAVKLLGIITGRKIKEVKSTKRIPSFGVRPGLKTGCMVTIREKGKLELLKMLLAAVNNRLNKEQIKDNHFSFGIKEYLEIPEMEYQRDIGILGLDVTAVFCRAGKRVKFKKRKWGKLPKKQNVTADEIIEYLQNKLGVVVE